MPCAICAVRSHISAAAHERVQNTHGYTALSPHPRPLKKPFSSSRTTHTPGARRIGS